MDITDEKIIRCLASDSDRSGTELAPILNLSVPAINKRIAKLKENGVIRKTTVLTDGGAVGKDVLAFVLLSLSDFSQSEEVIRRLVAEEDILECYAISGDYDYLVKLCAKGIDDLEDKLLSIKGNGGVKSQTLMCLREYKFEPAILP